MFGNLLCTIALLATLSLLFTKGFMVFVAFIIVDWVIIGNIWKSWNGDRQGEIDAKAGIQGGTSVFNIITIVLVLLVTFFYH